MIEISNQKETTQGARPVRLKNLFARIRKVKHFEVYAAIIVICIMSLIFFSSFTGGKKTTTSNLANQIQITTEATLEQRLTFLLQNVRDIGQIDVMMTDYGIVVLATHGDDPKVQIRILEAIQTLIPPNTIKIKILPRK